MKNKYYLLLIALCIIQPGYVLAGTVKGKLSVSGYKILAIAKNTRSVVATVDSAKKFSIKIKRGSSLHLVTTSGQYAGPIVAPTSTKARDILNGKSGNIGKVTVKSGFGRVSFSKAGLLFDSKTISYNATSGPKGAGKLGLVQAASSAVLSQHAKSLGEDSDGDGIPDILDIDDDGDLVLDISDPLTHSNVDFEAESFSALQLNLASTVNANITAFVESDVDSSIQNNLLLEFFVRNNTAGAKTLTSANVDCQSLSYCAPTTGIATVEMTNAAPANGSKWVNYDPDNDTFPNLNTLGESSLIPARITIKPAATRAQLHLGDTVFFKLNTSGGAITLPAVLPFYFVTVPALKEYNNGAVTTAVSYPVKGNDDGSNSHPIDLQGQTVALTFWRPQRVAVTGAESGSFIDIGNLFYGVSLTPQGSGSFTCIPSDYTNPSGTLSIMTNAGSSAKILSDASKDAASSSANTLSFTLDVGACLTRNGVSTSGKKVTVQLTASSSRSDQASQSFVVRLP
jgi:hypothetical protein